MDKKLRGCIGTFTAMSVNKGLSEYAIQRYRAVISSSNIVAV